MKTLAALILTALLAACGDCPPEVAPLPVAEVVAPTPAPVVEPEPIVTQPALPVFCTDKITTNCEVQFCPQSSAGCPPSPAPAPRCNPNDPSCKVLFCQPVGYCPEELKPPPLVLNVYCPENPEDGCPPNRI